MMMADGGLFRAARLRCCPKPSAPAAQPSWKWILVAGPTRTREAHPGVFTVKL
jgi:hypothetical protein